MHPILTLLRKDFLGFSKDKVAVGLTFVVPVVLIYIMGNVFGVNRSSSGPTGIALAIVNESSAPEIATLIDALKREASFRVIESTKDRAGVARPLTEAVVREGFRQSRYRFALVFPADATDSAAFGVRIRFLYNPRNDIETQMVTGLLQKNIYTNAPALLMNSLKKQSEQFIGTAETSRFYDQMSGVIAQSFGGDQSVIRKRMETDPFSLFSPPTPSSRIPATNPAAPALSGAGMLERVIKLESEQLAGAQVRNAGATRAVGGWAIMFLLFALSGTATSLFDEKKAGLFLRLLSSPVTRSQILLAKYLFGIALGVVQLIVLFFAGRLMFGIDVTSNFGNLVAICLVTATACTAFGMLLAAITKTPAAASGLATLLVLTMSAIGGAWFPTTLMPDVIQQLAKLSVVYWAMEGFLQVLWNNCTFTELLPTLGVLLAFAAVLVSISLWRFNKGAIFA
jgi:ABC-2 type transport system permease protein